MLTRVHINTWSILDTVMNTHYLLFEDSFKETAINKLSPPDIGKILQGRDRKDLADFLSNIVYSSYVVSISTKLYSSILSPLDPEAEVRVRGHVARRPQSRTSPGHARTRGPRTPPGWGQLCMRPSSHVAKPTFTDFNLESVEDVLLLYSDGFPKLFFGVSSKFWDISTQ